MAAQDETALAEEILVMCKRWHTRAVGVVDDACFAKTGHSAGSIGDEFNRKGVRFKPARKADRISGWQIMRRLLADAGKPNVPGLQLLLGHDPHLAGDQKRIEDLDSSGADHAADACRYGLMKLSRPAMTIRMGVATSG